jgi:zinc protease
MFGADPKDKAGRFFVFAQCNPMVIDRVEKAASEEIDKWVKEGITAAELAEAQKSWLAQRQVQRSSDASLASMLDAGLFLDRTFAWHADLEKKVAALKVDEVNAAVKKNIQPKSLVIYRAGDFKK